MALLTERYAKQIRGVLSCFDRVVIHGVLPNICHSQGMAAFLWSGGIRIFDYTKFAEPLRDQIRENAERLARENGIEIEFVRSSKDRKEDKVAAILKQRGSHPGLVCILSAMESCPSFLPWFDKSTGKAYLRGKQSKCSHYYFYFLHEEFGLCYLRVPTWAPFRLQFYFNGHHWLARKLDQAGIAHTQIDNTFTSIESFERAQALADLFPVDRLHQELDRLAAELCPVAEQFGSTYHWSLMQVEYATDIVFYRQSDLHPLYETLSRTAIHTVKPERIATFLGRKVTGNYQDEMGNDFHTRVEGTCIKHHMGMVSIKMYDKFGLVLRIETTTNDVSFFKHYREVAHKDGTSETKYAAMRKTIYSLPPLRELLAAANRRYLEFLSDLDDPSAGIHNVEKLSGSVRQNERNYRGFNLFASADLDLLTAIARGEFTVSGFDNKALRSALPGHTGAQVSRLLKRLRLHGLIKKVGKHYKYYLTKFGRATVLAALKLRELVVIPALARPQAA